MVWLSYSPKAALLFVHASTCTNAIRGAFGGKVVIFEYPAVELMRRSGELGTGSEQLFNVGM